jgi:hypothetical protein
LGLPSLTRKPKTGQIGGGLTFGSYFYGGVPVRERGTPVPVQHLGSNLPQEVSAPLPHSLQKAKVSHPTLRPEMAWTSLANRLATSACSSAILAESPVWLAGSSKASIAFRLKCAVTR